MAIPSAEYGTGKYGESLYGTVQRDLTDSVSVSDSTTEKKLSEHSGKLKIDQA